MLPVTYTNTMSFGFLVHLSNKRTLDHCPTMCSGCCSDINDIKSCFTQEKPISILHSSQCFFLFMLVGHKPIARDLDQAAEIELRKHRAHASLLLAEQLGQGQSMTSKRTWLNNEICCTIVPMVKYREIFQVKNNNLSTYKYRYNNYICSFQ